MARQVITIGAPDTSESNRLAWWRKPYPIIDASLMDLAGAQAVLRLFSLDVRASDAGAFYGNFVARLITTAGAETNPQESETKTGEDFTSAVENYASAYTITAGSASITLPGFNHSSWSGRDTTDPYAANANAARRTAIQSFITSYRAQSQSARDNTTLTIDDGARSGAAATITALARLSSATGRAIPTVVVRRGAAAPIQAEATLSSAEGTAIPPLQLSDYDRTGLEVDFAALIEVEVSANDVYFATGERWTDQGSLLGGELDFGAGDDGISRMFWFDSAHSGVPADSVGLFRFNDHPAAVSIGDFFSGLPAGWRLDVMVRAGEVHSQEVSGRTGSSGPNWVNIGVSDAGLAAAMNGLATGDRMILALAREVTKRTGAADPITALATLSDASGRASTVKRTGAAAPMTALATLSNASGTTSRVERTGAAAPITALATLSNASGRASTVERTGTAAPITANATLTDASGRASTVERTGEAAPIEALATLSNASGRAIGTVRTGAAATMTANASLSNATGTARPPTSGAAAALTALATMSDASGRAVPVERTGEAAPLTALATLSDASGTVLPVERTGEAAPLTALATLSNASGTVHPNRVADNAGTLTALATLSDASGRAVDADVLEFSVHVGIDEFDLGTSLQIIRPVRMAVHADIDGFDLGVSMRTVTAIRSYVEIPLDIRVSAELLDVVAPPVDPPVVPPGPPRLNLPSCEEPVVEQMGVCEAPTTTEQVGCVPGNLILPVPVHIGAEIDLGALDAFVSAAIVRGTIEFGVLVDLSGLDARTGLKVSVPTHIGTAIDLSPLEAKVSARVTEGVHLGVVADISDIDARATLVGFGVKLSTAVDLQDLEAAVSLDVKRPVEMEVVADIPDFDMRVALEVGTREGEVIPPGEGPRPLRGPKRETLLRVMAGLDEFDARASLEIGATPTRLGLFSNPTARAAVPGDTVEFRLSVSGNGQAPFVFTKQSGVSWLDVDGNTGVVSGTVPTGTPAGVVGAEFGVTDANRVFASTRVSVTVNEVAVNPVTLYLNKAIARGNRNQDLSAQLTASGGTGPYTYRKVSGPTWVTVGRLTGRVTGVVPANQAEGDYVARFEAEDSLGETDGINLTLRVSLTGAPSRASSKDIDLSSGLGLTSAFNNGTHIWTVGGTVAYAWRIGTGRPTRDSSRDFNLDSANDFPKGACSDNTTAWIVDRFAPPGQSNKKVFGYRLGSSGAPVRDSSKDFDLDSNLDSPVAAFTNGTHIWVVDDDDRQAYAYRINSSGAPTRDSSRDFNIISKATFAEAACTDGTYAWIVDRGIRGPASAYRIGSSGAPTRFGPKDFETEHPNNNPGGGATCDGETIWIIDGRDHIAYAYAI